jgi:hypothetical protein
MIYHLWQVRDGFFKLVNPVRSVHSHWEQEHAGKLLVYVSVTVQTIILLLKTAVFKVRNITNILNTIIIKITSFNIVQIIVIVLFESQQQGWPWENLVYSINNVRVQKMAEGVHILKPMKHVVKCVFAKKDF